MQSSAHFLPLVALLILGGAGAWWGWWVGTKAFYRRSDDAMEEPFASRTIMSPRLSRLKRQRLLLTGLVCSPETVPL
jgi:hypothetical protein